MARPSGKTHPAVDLKSIARIHTESAIRTLAAIMAQAKQPAGARVIAAQTLLDRGWGKAPQQLTGEDGGDIRITIRQILANAVETEPKLIENEDEQDDGATS